MQKLVEKNSLLKCKIDMSNWPEPFTYMGTLEDVLVLHLIKVIDLLKEGMETPVRDEG